MFDSIIIGSGPAGMSAAIYGARNNLNIAIVESSAPGGQMINTSTIENYPGFKKIDGASLSLAMYEQVNELNVQYIFGNAIAIHKNNYFEVQVDNQKYQSKTVIVATGAKNRKLNIPGESKYVGKGISWCAICDGSFYKGKKVAVIGGGNSSLEEAIYLSSIASDVYIIHRRPEFRAEDGLVSKVKEIKNIHLVTNVDVVEFCGDDKLNGVKVKDKENQKDRVIEVSGCFEYIGMMPSSELLSGFDVVNEQGYVVVDENYETKVKGLFACGDVVNKKIRQIATAINDGAIAALSASKECK